MPNPYRGDRDDEDHECDPDTEHCGCIELAEELEAERRGEDG